MAPQSSHEQGMKAADPLIYVRIYADADGASHFADESVPFELKDYAPPAAPMSVSQLFGAQNLAFISSPAGYHGDWHPAPTRQFIFVLSGEIEVEVSDGETRRLGPGAVCFVEDTAGRGHLTRVVGSERSYVAAVPVR
jgi:hypothetical protein